MHMFLFIGTPELILVFIVALLIFGPEQIPHIARNLGKGIRMLRDGMNEAKREIYKDAAVQELDKTLQKGREKLEDELKQVRQIMDAKEEISRVSETIKGRIKRN